METRLEQTILNNLILSEEYTRKVIPFLRSEYFTDSSEQLIFKIAKEYFDRYTKNPTVEALLITLDKTTDQSDKVVESSRQLLENLQAEESPFEWIVEETEQWCKDRAIYLAVMSSIDVLDKKSQISTGEITDLLKDALSVSFDTNIGNDVLEDADDRFEFYNKEEEKIPFEL